MGKEGMVATVQGSCSHCSHSGSQMLMLILHFHFYLFWNPSPQSSAAHFQVSLLSSVKAIVDWSNQQTSNHVS